MARFAALLLAAVFLLNLYRAATQGVTIDEAYSYWLYVGHHPFGLLNHYDANLHFLHTLATWLSVRLLGASEFTLTLPSLAAVYRIGKHTTWWAVLWLIANPLIEDHLTAARGYGMALACFAWAMVEPVRDRGRLPAAALARMALWLSLSVGANLTFYSRLRLSSP